MVPVLNQISRCRQDVTAILNTSVPGSFFASRLQMPWQLNEGLQDIGCVQDGPLHIDVPATWAAYRHLHRQWDDAVQSLSARMREASPDLVLSDISHVGTAAGAAAGIPTVALCSLTWDAVLELYTGVDVAEEQRILEQIRRGYAGATCLIRPTPGIAVKAFQRVIDVGPICEPAVPQAQVLRSALDLQPDDCVVLVGFGGISQKTLPFQALESLAPFQFLVDGDVPPGLTRVRSTKDIPVPFRALIASVDLILTKPGYGTIVEAVALQKPVVYVRRYNFADEQVLVDYLHRYGRGAELRKDAFVSGQWGPALTAASQAPSPALEAPSSIGAAAAASHLLPYLT